MRDQRVLLEVADVVRRSGYMPPTVRQWVTSGQLPVYARTVRGTRLFHPADVERLMASLHPREAPRDARQRLARPRQRRRLDYGPRPTSDRGESGAAGGGTR